ncbi:hypothetical protein LCGC14_0516780 [marine sediment metagenome]|uniref:Uncharacterized protein n=1 Tax=marine sediment metagenome TaxID=412755 RepID=A0A0F9S4C8_9ZZZZ
MARLSPEQLEEKINAGTATDEEIDAFAISVEAVPIGELTGFAAENVPPEQAIDPVELSALPPPISETSPELRRFVPRAATGIAAAALVSAVAAPEITLPVLAAHRILAAGAGGGLGELFSGAVRRGGGVPGELLGGPFEGEDIPIKKIAGDVGYAMIEQATFETPAAAATALAAKAKTPFAKSFSEAEMGELLEFGKSIGTELSVGQQVTSRTADTAENIIRASLGGGKLEEFIQTNIQITADHIQAFATGIGEGMSAETAGRKVLQAIRQRKAVSPRLAKLAKRAADFDEAFADVIVSSIFEDVKAGFGNTRIDMLPIKGRPAVQPTGTFGKRVGREGGPKVVSPPKVGREGGAEVVSPPVKPKEFGFREGTISGEVGEGTVEAFRKGTISGEIGAESPAAFARSGRLETAGQEGIFGVVDEAEAFLRGGRPGEGAGKGIVETKVRRVFNAVKEMPDNATFEAVKNVRSRLSELTVDKTLSQSSKSAVVKVLNAFDEAIEAAATGSGVAPGTANRFKFARRLKTAIEGGRQPKGGRVGERGRFGNEIVKAALRKKDSEIIPMLLREGRVSDLRVIRKALTNEDWGKLVIPQFFTEMAGGSKSLAPDGALSGQKLVRRLRNLRTGGNLDIMFQTAAEKASFNHFRKAAELLAIQQSKQIAGAGTVVIKLVEGGMVIRGLATPTPGRLFNALMVIAVPRMMSRIMSSPKGVEWLTKGRALQVGTAEGNQLVAEMFGFLAEQRILEKAGETGLSKKAPRTDPFAPLPGALAAPLPSLPPPPPLR